MGAKPGRTSAGSTVGEPLPLWAREEGCKQTDQSWSPILEDALGNRTGIQDPEQILSCTLQPPTPVRPQDGVEQSLQVERNRKPGAGP